MCLPTGQEGITKPWNPDGSARDRLIHTMQAAPDRLICITRRLEVHSQDTLYIMYPLPICDNRAKYIGILRQTDRKFSATRPCWSKGIGGALTS